MAYCRSMVAPLLRLLAALALIAMPLGMAHAGPPAQSSPAALEMGHCAEHPQPSQAPARQDGHCAACVVLSYSGAADAPIELIPQTPLSVPPTDLRVGLEPEVVTPPPKFV